MTKVVIDAAMRKKLHNLAETLELCDETGRVLGRFLPEPQLSEEELQRRENETESYTTAEVLAYLKSSADDRKN